MPWEQIQCNHSRKKKFSIVANVIPFDNVQSHLKGDFWSDCTEHETDVFKESFSFLHLFFMCIK